jgi:hypothetical protein
MGFSNSSQSNRVSHVRKVERAVQRRARKCISNVRPFYCDIDYISIYKDRLPGTRLLPLRKAHHGIFISD